MSNTSDGGERFNIKPSDLAEARAEGRMPRKNLIRDAGEVHLADTTDRARPERSGSTPESRDQFLRDHQIGPYAPKDTLGLVRTTAKRVKGGWLTESGWVRPLARDEE